MGASFFVLGAVDAGPILDYMVTYRRDTRIPGMDPGPSSVGMDRQEGHSMKLRSMTRVIGGKRYSTETAAVIADDCFWDGHNWERSGRNAYLCKTPKGSYFRVNQTCWQGERDTLAPLTEDEAVELWEHLPEHNDIPFEEAFPGRVVEDA